MFTRYLIPLSLVMLSSCILSDTVVVPDKTDSGSLLGVTGSITIPEPVGSLSGSADIYTVIFNGLETKTIPVKHIKGTTTTIEFLNREAKSMRVVVTFPKNTSNGNLRLSQIVMPDGNMDGPFGTDTTVNLAQKGGYELRFRENMMSGDPWSGEAIITITLIGK